jgi:N-acyl-D-amino-acid deacylase
MNVASFVGATTVRQHELGERDVDPTPEQLERMRALVRQAMEEGALGVGTSSSTRRQPSPKPMSSSR